MKIKIYLARGLNRIHAAQFWSPPTWFQDSWRALQVAGQYLEVNGNTRKPFKAGHMDRLLAALSRKGARGTTRALACP